MPAPHSDARIATFDAHRQAPWEIGAGLMALLAWPGEEDRDQMVAGFEAICAVQVQSSKLSFPDEAREWDSAYPLYASLEPREIKRRLRTFRNRLRARMIASHMALYLFERNMVAEPQALPPSIKRPSINAFAAYVRPETRISDQEMVERRIWRPSWPVIHLATALQVMGRQLGRDFTVAKYPVEDGELHQFVIELAGRHEAIVLADRAFGGRPERLIRFRHVG